MWFKRTYVRRYVRTDGRTDGRTKGYLRLALLARLSRRVDLIIIIITIIIIGTYIRCMIFECFSTVLHETNYYPSGPDGVTTAKRRITGVSRDRSSTTDVRRPTLVARRRRRLSTIQDRTCSGHTRRRSMTQMRRTEGQRPPGDTSCRCESVNDTGLDHRSRVLALTPPSSPGNAHANGPQTRVLQRS